MKFKDGGFYTVEKIGPRRERTPEGFLLCREVPISRVGSFEYTSLEAGGLPGKGGRVMLTRSADELFSPETMASFEGKPIVIGHGRFADPKNWKEISLGHVQNVRRGEGAQSDLLLADLLLQDERGIQLVESGELEEVSCGYDAETVGDGEGLGHQVGIVGNHVALVEKARCSGCKIGDGFMPDEDKTLENKETQKTGDEDGIKPPVDQEKTPEERISVLEHEYQEMGQKLSAMQAALEKMAGGPEGDKTPQGDEDDESEAEVVEDSEAKTVIGDAEELCPGMKKPQGDAKGGKFTRGLLNRVKRVALKGSDKTFFGDASELDGKALDIAFKAAVAMARAQNNPTAKARSYGDGKPEDRSNAALNKRLNDFWGKK